jgi:hypothetical protein
METEHCHGAAATRSFTTINYRITTCPLREWQHVVQRRPVPADQMRGGRRIPRVEELLRHGLVVEAGLQRAEVIATVLYSGPMVSGRGGGARAE